MLPVRSDPSLDTAESPIIFLQLLIRIQIQRILWYTFLAQELDLKNRFHSEHSTLIEFLFATAGQAA